MMSTIHVPFTRPHKPGSVVVTNKPTSQHPKTVKVYFLLTLLFIAGQHGRKGKRWLCLLEFE